MAPGGIRPVARSGRASALALLSCLLVAACSGSAATTGPSPSVAASSAVPTATTAPTAAPTKGPATQHLSLAGPAGAAGAVSLAGIRCNLPSPGGLQISVLGQPADPNLSVYIFVSSGNVSVRYDSGSGSTYVERDFAGTGVTNFDAGRGVQIDSPLTEVPNSDAHGSLGVLTSISGSIDCGNQQPGSSTLSFSGPTPKGALSGGLAPVNVECITNTFGQSVSVLGIAQVDSVPTFLVISISPGTLSVSASSDGFYRNTSTTQAALTATGAHVAATYWNRTSPRARRHTRFTSVVTSSAGRRSRADARATTKSDPEACAERDFAIARNFQHAHNQHHGAR